MRQTIAATSLLLLLLTSQSSLAQFTTEKAIDSTQTGVEEQKMQLLVTDFKTKRVMEADVMVKGLNPRKTVVFKELSDTTLVLKKYREYTVSVVKKGYLYFAHKFWPDEKALHLERIELKPLQIGLKASIEDIYFLGDETEIYYKSLTALEELTNYLNENPTVKICLIGHANGPIGSEQKSDNFYKKMSEKRAEAIRDYLVQHGIDEDRLTTRGEGNKQMLYPDPETDWQVNANRRIEIEITSF
ncbi:MAG: OmpA family protein [Flavobacteriales bacterium]